MVGMQHDGNSVHFGQFVHMLCSADSSCNGSLLRIIGQALSGDKSRTAVGELNDHRRIDIPRRFQHSVDGVAARAVHGRHGKSFFLGKSEQFGQRLTCYDSRFDLVAHGVFVLCEALCRLPFFYFGDCLISTKKPRAKIRFFTHAAKPVPPLFNRL